MQKYIFNKMPSHSLLHFITNIINFEGFKATNYHFITENELLIELENKEKLSICPHCQNKTDKVHQSHRYIVRDIPISDWDVLLLVNRRQFIRKKKSSMTQKKKNLRSWTKLLLN